MPEAEKREVPGTLPRTGQGSGLPVSKVLPAYQQVANQLRTLILHGDLAPGDRLPNEAELAAHFGVSRSTVREALRVLASRDLVETSRGSRAAPSWPGSAPTGSGSTSRPASG